MIEKQVEWLRNRTHSILENKGIIPEKEYVKAVEILDSILNNKEYTDSERGRIIFELKLLIDKSMIFGGSSNEH